MDSDKPEPLKEIKSPRDRLAVKLNIEQEYDAASKLLAQGLYKESLKKFKTVFSHDPPSNFFLSPVQIRKLLKEYPAATAIVKRWRNDKERLIKAHTADLPLIRQWSTLNSCLGQHERTEAVYVQLTSSGASEELTQDILGEIWKSFVRRKKYCLLENFLPRLGFYLLLNATEYESLQLFPRQNELSESECLRNLARLTNYMLSEGILIYEVALGLGQKQIAAEFAQKILAVQKSDHAYALLIKAAIRTKSYSEAATVFQQARQVLSIRKLKETSSVFKTIPESKLNSQKFANEN